uniref:Large ribosomal subunit protein uL5c n=1 Tax=Chara vulgaris TaxID=55564 RepID=RK5_CHAVU|nr:ribosomal protein L5 [Chara vulgaris]Q1ACG2.1 RecName: Full=Large ribosomal subunit protein uL5c; AltName: Full=50S ribosomal protein L5, chloroplastic [Chara vulgaris]ABA61982.1 ribosomal protein L5 [Chara vulgaris]WAP91351.1 ribosomal protein L5 [Chara vulgaris]
MIQRLKKFYLDNVVPDLYQKFEYTNIHQLPYLKKIVINCGFGEASQNSKFLEGTIKDLSIIASQKPIVTRARKAIAGFQIRKKMPVGVCVTLRGETMYAFLDRLIHLALPRIKDFQGLNWKSFDGYGNFHFGIREQLIFPEIHYDKIDKIRGMNISIITSCHTDTEALHFLTSLGIPFDSRDSFSTQER